MSMKKYCLKLLGGCFEADFPSIVYGYPHQGCLANYTFREEGSLPWKIRLKIDSESSYALAYLQNGFSRPVIFRDFQSKYVFLDKDYEAKLTGFYFSTLIPEGQHHVNDAIVATAPSGGPDYIISGRLTEKTDVYAFGFLLFELLAGKVTHNEFYHHCQLFGMVRDHGENIDIGTIVDPAISKETRENGKQQQLQEVFDLALRCTAYYEDDRPSIIDVASELKKLLDS